MAASMSCEALRLLIKEDRLDTLKILKRIGTAFRYEADLIRYVQSKAMLHFLLDDGLDFNKILTIDNKQIAGWFIEYLEEHPDLKIKETTSIHYSFASVLVNEQPSILVAHSTDPLVSSIGRKGNGYIEDNSMSIFTHHNSKSMDDMIRILRLKSDPFNKEMVLLVPQQVLKSCSE